MRAFFRSFLSEPRAPGAPPRVWRDWVLAGLLIALSIVEVIVRDPLPYRWPSFAVAMAGIPFLLVRRTRPLLAVVAVFGAVLLMDIPWIVGDGDPPGLYTLAYVLILAYALFRWGSGREAVIGLPIMLVPAMLALVFDYTGLGDAIGGFGVFFGAITLGIAMRDRTRARLSRLDQVRAAEREALARDLHDTVAHHISAIAIRAQAGIATASQDPAAAIAALHVIDGEASRTLAEMRTIVRALRRDDVAELAPLPGIDDVRELAESPHGGPPVHVELRGDSEHVPGPVATAAYRLAQESVTNARRHARRASRIDVVVRTDDDAVTVEVTDDGERPPARGRDGYGIVGMIERAERLGGTCSAGPRAERGWAVTAVLPLRGAAT